MRSVLVAALLFVSTSAMAGTSAGYGMAGNSRASIRSSASIINQVSCFASKVAASRPAPCFSAWNATLLFHAGHDRNKNITTSSTGHLLSAYNASLRDYVTSNHYMDTLEFHSISGRDMIQKFGYRECPKK